MSVAQRTDDSRRRGYARYGGLDISVEGATTAPLSVDRENRVSVELLRIALAAGAWEVTLEYSLNYGETWHASASTIANTDSKKTLEAVDCTAWTSVRLNVTTPLANQRADADFYANDLGT